MGINYMGNHHANQQQMKYHQTLNDYEPTNNHNQHHAQHHNQHHRHHQTYHQSSQIQQQYHGHYHHQHHHHHQHRSTMRPYPQSPISPPTHTTDFHHGYGYESGGFVISPEYINNVHDYNSNVMRQTLTDSITNPQYLQQYENQPVLTNENENANANANSEIDDEKETMKHSRFAEGLGQNVSQSAFEDTQCQSVPTLSITNQVSNDTTSTENAFIANSQREHEHDHNENDEDQESALELNSGCNSDSHSHSNSDSRCNTNTNSNSKSNSNPGPLETEVEGEEEEEDDDDDLSEHDHGSLLILLDWDDTLFPTTMINEILHSRDKNDLALVRDDQITYLQRLGKLTLVLLTQLINKYGANSIHIVTNSLNGWITESLAYASCITPIYKQIELLLITNNITMQSAQSLYAKKIKNSTPTQWKQYCFDKIIDINKYHHILSIGDQWTDHYAVKQSLASLFEHITKNNHQNDDKPIHKPCHHVIKLKMTPSVNDMINEILYIQACFTQIFNIISHKKLPYYNHPSSIRPVIIDYHNEELKHLNNYQNQNQFYQNQYVNINNLNVNLNVNVNVINGHNQTPKQYNL